MKAKSIQETSELRRQGKMMNIIYWPRRNANPTKCECIIIHHQTATSPQSYPMVSQLGYLTTTTIHSRCTLNIFVTSIPHSVNCLKSVMNKIPRKYVKYMFLYGFFVARTHIFLQTFFRLNKKNFTSLFSLNGNFSFIS